MIRYELSDSQLLSLMLSKSKISNDRSGLSRWMSWNVLQALANVLEAINCGVLVGKYACLFLAGLSYRLLLDKVFQPRSYPRQARVGCEHSHARTGWVILVLRSVSSHVWGIALGRKNIWFSFLMYKTQKGHLIIIVWLHDLWSTQSRETRTHHAPTYLSYPTCCP